MPVLPSVADSFTRRMPRFVNAKNHAITDRVTTGAFLFAAMVFWRRNRRAAVGALTCGALELALNSLTDYPGGVAKLISFPGHGKLEVGLAGLTATMPELLNFHRDSERTFFLVQAGIMTANTNLTNFQRPKLVIARKRRA